MKKLKIIYDVDDTLWNLTDTVYEKNGLTRADATVYTVTDNPNLNKKQIKNIYRDFSDPHLFTECKFYDGHKRIFDIDKAGKADVYISSGNLTEAVRDVKLIRLLHEIPNIRPENIRMTVMSQVHQGRELGDILIDDSMRNIIDHDFTLNIVVAMPHNQNTIVPNKNIIRAKTLNDAVDIIETIVEYQQRTGVINYGKFWK